MERLTKEVDKKAYVIDASNINNTVNGCSGNAIDTLAKFENVYESIVANQEDTLKKIETLRSQGKTNTVSFKTLLVKKLTNENMLNLFKIYGLE